MCKLKNGLQTANTWVLNVIFCTSAGKGQTREDQLQGSQHA